MVILRAHVSRMSAPVASAAMLCAAAAVFTAAAPARADISPIVFNITATNSQGTATFSAVLPGATQAPRGTLNWRLSGPVSMRSSSGTVIATLGDARLFIIEDPLVSVAFSVQAAASDTVFEINSALLSFPGINNAEGRADGSISATDINGNGVTLTGLQPGGSMLIAQYNGFVPNGTTFSDMIPGPLSSPNPFGSIASSGVVPASGFTPIPGTVSDISLQYRFMLSAGDLASGTAVFEVVPAPGAAGLLVMAGAVAIRRRR